jgi:hypothetical protein
MSSSEPTDEEVVQAIYDFAAEQMVNGASDRQVESMLREKGLDAESAATVVSNLAEHREQARAKAGQGAMISGALWCIGGIAVTAITYQAASGGGTYVVAWGAILFGAIQFFRGLAASAG